MKSSLEHVSQKEKEGSGLNQQEVGKSRATAKLLLLGHVSRFPPFSWFSSVFASLVTGTWPEDFHRVKELLCSPNPSLQHALQLGCQENLF